MMEPNLVILAGGISSRMKKGGSHAEPIDPALMRQAEETSKSMIGLGEGGRPFLDYLLHNAREAGYRDIVIVIGEKDRSMREYYAGSEVSFAIQKIPSGRLKPLGTADALLQALYVTPRWRGQQFTVCNSDNLYSPKALRLLLECAAPGGMIDYDRGALKFEPERIGQFAVIEIDQQGYLLDIIEKPPPEVIERVKDRTGHVGVSMNIWRLSYDLILPCLESVPVHPVRLEKELPTAVAMMIHEHSSSVLAIPLAEPVPDLTNQSDIPRVQEYLRKEFPDSLLP